MLCYWINIIAIVLYFSKCSVPQLVISLPDGKIRGHELKSPHNRSFHAFEGIPYASPPTGELRFLAPKPPEKWNDILNVTQYNSICYQARKTDPDETEDCLHLSVFTPVLENKTQAKLPVIFWIYGGGFSHGDIRYSGQGDYFIEENIVIVTFNYRVGPFGFLSTGDHVIPGNAGLKDQLLALKWTHKNIHNFGGDANLITILGISAGGASTGYHILSNQSSGLFRAGIAQSGSPLNIWAFTTDPKPYAYDLANKIEGLNTSNYNSQELAKYLKNATADQIDAASWNTSEVTALPVIEVSSDEAFITQNMYDQLQSGNINRVPLLIGTVSEEQVNRAENLEALNSALVHIARDYTKLIPMNFIVKNNFTKKQVGEHIYRLYFDDVAEDERLGHLVRYYSQNQFSRALIKHAELQSNFTSVYFYQFSYIGPMGYTSSNVSIKGADQISHGGEKYYTTGIKSELFNNEDFSKFPESDGVTHTRMVKLWANFVKYLNPTPNKIELLQNITWPTVAPGNFLYLNIDKNLTIMETPKKIFYLGWKDVFEKYAVKPFITF